MSVAINGVGIAGPTLGYWLREYGHEPVLFEKAEQLSVAEARHQACAIIDGLLDPGARL